MVALGGTGGVASDYNGAFDRAAAVDLTLTPPTINLPTTFGGPSVTDAFRFWCANPTLDNGYALELRTGATNELRFVRSEIGLDDHGPVLTITYALPVVGPAPPPEVSGPGAPLPLLAAKEGSQVHFHFQDLGALASAYNVHEGTIGQWFSHTGVACGQVPGTMAPGLDLVHTPATGSRYFQITGENACGEGPAAAGWPPALLDCP